MNIRGGRVSRTLVAGRTETTRLWKDPCKMLVSIQSGKITVPLDQRPVLELYEYIHTKLTHPQCASVHP